MKSYRINSELTLKNSESITNKLYKSFCKYRPGQARDKPALVHQCHPLSLPTAEAHRQHAVLNMHKIFKSGQCLLFTCNTVMDMHFYIPVINSSYVWKSALNKPHCNYSTICYRVKRHFVYRQDNIKKHTL